MTAASILESFTNKISSLFASNSTSATILEIKLAIFLITVACLLSALALVALVISHIRLKQKLRAKVEGTHPSTTYRLASPTKNSRQAQ
jgi:hypothetical protein